jgi:hypothetical protein
MKKLQWIVRQIVSAFQYIPWEVHRHISCLEVQLQNFRQGKRLRANPDSDCYEITDRVRYCLHITRRCAYRLHHAAFRPRHVHGHPCSDISRDCANHEIPDSGRHYTANDCHSHPKPANGIDPAPDRPIFRKPDLGRRPSHREVHRRIKPVT